MMDLTKKNGIGDLTIENKWKWRIQASKLSWGFRCHKWMNTEMSHILVGGLEHGWIIFPYIGNDHPN